MIAKYLTDFFDTSLLFPVLLFLTAAMTLAFAFFLPFVKKNNIEQMEKLPRLKIPGMILGVFVLAWCIPHTMPILPDSLHKFLAPAMIFATVCSWFVLDHLFARALGGYMILTAHLFLRESYGMEGLNNPVFAVVFLIYGTLGIILCGVPYRLRDIIRLELKPVFRWIFPLILFFFSMIFLITGFRSLRYFL